jgi:hypothetical protein
MKTESATRDSKPTSHPFILPRGWPVTAICAPLLLIHLGFRISSGKIGDGLDPVALGLVVVMISPWLTTIIASTKFAGVEFKFRQIQEAVREQRTELDTLQFLIGHFLGRDELRHLQRLSSGNRFEIDVNIYPEELKAELRQLRALGLIENYEGKGIRTMFQPSHTTKRDVRQFFYLTDSGRKFLELHAVVTPSEPQSPSHQQ